MAQSNLFFLRSYVRQQEFDFSQMPSAPVGTVAFIQGEFNRGPTDDAKYVNSSGFAERYDAIPDPTVSFAADTAMQVLSASASALVYRLTNQAKYAAADLFLDTSTPNAAKLLFLPLPQGLDKGYDKSGIINTSGVSLLVLPLLEAGDTFEMNISDGETVAPVEVPFSGTHNDTMAAIALAITSAIQAYSPTLQGSAVVYNDATSPIASRFKILLRKPSDADIEFLDPTVDGNTTAPIIIESDTNWLGTMVAENQGEWGDTYGGKITGVNQGTRERYRLTFSGPLVTGNSVAIIINDQVAATVPFNTSSDQTMQDIAAALTASPAILSATVDEVAGAINNDRSMLIIANDPGVDTVAITAPVVTGGASQPIAIVNKILNGQESTGTLTLEVYNSASVNFPVETFTFSLFKQQDGRGDQLGFDSVINQGPRSSNNIRFIANPELTTKTGFNPILKELLKSTTEFRSTIAWMAGGDNGLTVTTGQMVSALDKFKDRIRYPVNLLLSSGYTSIAYMQALDNLARYRGDSTAILDMPVGKQLAQDARNFRLFELNIDSSYSALYTPNVRIPDPATNEERFIPPSGPVAAAYIYNDRVRNRYAAPAGLNRGPIRNALGLLHEYSPEDLELLNPVGINTIVNKPATGPTIMWEDTLQLANSALRSVHIRRTMNDVKTTLADSVEWQLMEGNTETTRFNVLQLAESVLSQVHRSEGLYEYLAKCDDENNTKEVIDMDAIILDVYVKPVRVAKGILLRSIITRTSITFQEVTATFNP